jgi:glucose-1-phosphate cytidylyltransferase
MVEIGDRPILWHIMKTYAHYGHRDFALCLGYRGNTIKEYFLNYEAMNNDFTIGLGDRQSVVTHGAHDETEFSVTLANTGADTMTGGRLARVKKYIDDDTFMLTYGDGVADVDIEKLIAFHHSHGKIATMSTVMPVSRFGIVDIRADHQVQGFVEKPSLDQWINAGYFVLNRRVFDYLGGDDCVFEKEPIERLAADGELMAYRHDGFFFAMDTYREYKILNDMWMSNEAPWKVWR